MFMSNLLSVSNIVERKLSAPDGVESTDEF